MKIINYFKKFIVDFKEKRKLLLDFPENLYDDLISSSKINSIIENIPENISELEKAYYIYLELGKIISENPKFVFTDKQGKAFHYSDIIDDKYYGICKSISELYVSILKDKRINISADLVKKFPVNPLSHIDVILKINGKNYIVNLISDLSRIKTSKRTIHFCFDLNSEPIPILNKPYLDTLEDYYGKIYYLTREDIEQFDKKLGYSFFIPQFSPKNKSGIYTDDVINLLKKDMENPESFRKYVLHNQDVPKEEILKYKLDYIFKNINKLTDYTATMQYLENIRHYIFFSNKLLSPEEASRIYSYVATVNDDLSNIISILKIAPTNNTSNNIYYLYSNDDKTYIEQSPKQMKAFIDNLDKDSLKIIGTYDRYNPRNLEELELN